MKPEIKNYIPAIAWFLFILFATLSNASTLEKLNWNDLFNYDKPIHMILFGFQAALVMQARKKSHQTINLTVLFLVCALCAVYGICIEILQITITTSRSFDYFDMVANTVGCIIAYYWLRYKYRKLKLI